MRVCARDLCVLSFSLCDKKNKTPKAKAHLPIKKLINEFSLGLVLGGDSNFAFLVMCIYKHFAYVSPNSHSHSHQPKPLPPKRGGTYTVLCNFYVPFRRHAARQSYIGARASKRDHTLSSMSRRSAGAKYRTSSSRSGYDTLPGGRVPAHVCRARLLLLLAAILFGTYSVLMRLLFSAAGEPLPVIAVTCIRFSVIAAYSALLFAGKAAVARCRSACVGASAARAGANWRLLLLASAELAFYDLAGNLFSTYGLTQTDAIESELLLSTVSLFVPLLALLAGHSAGARTWLGCVLAFLGVVATAALCHGAALRRRLASSEGMAGPAELVLAAASYALGRVRLMAHLEKSVDAEQLVFGRVLGMVLGSALVVAADVARGGPTADLDFAYVTRRQWTLLLLSCLLSGFLGCLAQFRGQTTLGAASAQPLLALQPVFAACWAAALLSEPLSPWLALGGGLILLGALLATMDPRAALLTVDKAGGGADIPLEDQAEPDAEASEALPASWREKPRSSGSPREHTSALRALLARLGWWRREGGSAAHRLPQAQPRRRPRPSSSRGGGRRVEAGVRTGPAAVSAGGGDGDQASLTFC